MYPSHRVIAVKQVPDQLSESYFGMIPRSVTVVDAIRCECCVHKLRLSTCNWIGTNQTQHVVACLWLCACATWCLRLSDSAAQMFRLLVREKASPSKWKVRITSGTFCEHMSELLPCFCAHVLFCTSGMLPLVNAVRPLCGAVRVREPASCLFGRRSAVQGCQQRCGSGPRTIRSVRKRRKRRP